MPLLFSLPTLLAAIFGSGYGIEPPIWPPGYSFGVDQLCLTSKIMQSSHVYVSSKKNEIKAVLDGSNEIFIGGSRRSPYGPAGGEKKVSWYTPTSDVSRTGRVLLNPKQQPRKVPRTKTATRSSELPKRSECYWGLVHEDFGVDRILPNLGDYVFTGKTHFEGVESEKWRLMDTTGIEKLEDTVWIRYLDNNRGLPIPVARELKKNTLAGGTETAHILSTYYNYNPQEPDDSVWIQPKTPTCSQVNITSDELPAVVSLSKAGSSEGQTRRKLLEKRKAIVENHNKRSSSFKLELNKFAYMTEAEMRAYGNVGNALSSEISERQSFPKDNLLLRKAPRPGPGMVLDWRLQGAVTPVKDQGHCSGGSWAFAVVATMEAGWFNRSNQLVVMSEQNLIDCVPRGGPQKGCFGGSLDAGFDHAVKSGGIARTADYGPFVAVNNYCVQNKTIPVAPLDKYNVLENIQEYELKSLLLDYGPVAVTIRVTEELLLYKNGVFKDTEEGSVLGYTAVAVVGYGSSKHGPYFIAKNSWGTSWGLDGYILISQFNNTLGILDRVFLPIFK